MFCYQSHVFHLNIIFLFLYATPANPTLFYRWSLLPSVFRIFPPLMRKLVLKLVTLFLSALLLQVATLILLSHLVLKLVIFYFESSVVNTVFCFPASYLLQYKFSSSDQFLLSNFPQSILYRILPFSDLSPFSRIYGYESQYLSLVFQLLVLGLVWYTNLVFRFGIPVWYLPPLGCLVVIVSKHFVEVGESAFRPR